MTPLRQPSKQALSRLRSSAWHVAISALCFALPISASADSLQDAGKLLKQGQHAQALEEVDKYLASKPRDAQGRFLKGIILTEANKPAEAITVFTKLTEDYPELPEPYNNLAVIYAQQKNYEKARQSLEMAIRTHPSYATAHENLGDIYARMASQAYDKALQLDSSNSSAQSKLALIRDLMGAGARPSKPAKPVPTVAEPRPVELVKPAEPAKVAAAPVAATPAAAPPPAAGKPAEPAKASPSSNGEIIKVVDRWLAAWSNKDTKNYLAMYAKDFKTPSGETRSAWEADRKKRINKPGAINVSHDGLQVTIDGDSAVVKFRQHYKSAGLKSSSSKVLQMVKRDGNWLIQQERVGS